MKTLQLWSFNNLPLFLAAALAVTADLELSAAPKKIYVVTDLEGITGVYKFTQTRETDTPLARQARAFFMGDGQERPVP